ncbi:hypothetical protein AB2F23_25625 (plasmid) [Escherichia coli]
MEIKPEDELSNIVLFPVKEDDPRNQVNFLYEPSERPYCHHASVLDSIHADLISP